MGAELESVRVFWQLSLWGLDISITSAVLVLWSAVLIIFVISFLAVHRPKIVPGKLQGLIEIINEFWEEQTKDLFGEQSNYWLPFVLAIFMFVLVCNLLGMVPGVYPINSNINTTATLAVVVFLAYHFAGIKNLGFKGYLKSLMPEDVPLILWPLMFLLEITSRLARPFSLAVRLFANMTAGAVVGFTILSFIFVFKSYWLAGFPLFGKVTVSLFEVFIAFVQAYVFAYLSALYIGVAIEKHS